MTLKFLELDRVVWVETPDYIEAIRGLLTPALDRSYHILKNRLSPCPVWTLAMVPLGNEVMEEYQRLIDSTVMGHWTREVQLLCRKGFKEELLENVDFSATRSAQTEFSPTKLNDALIFECLFLFGVGIGLSMLAIVAEVVLNAISFMLRDQDLWVSVAV